MCVTPIILTLLLPSAVNSARCHSYTTPSWAKIPVLYLGCSSVLHSPSFSIWPHRSFWPHACVFKTGWTSCLANHFKVFWIRKCIQDGDNDDEHLNVYSWKCNSIQAITDLKRNLWFMNWRVAADTLTEWEQQWKTNQCWFSEISCSKWWWCWQIAVGLYCCKIWPKICSGKSSSSIWWQKQGQNFFLF